MPPGMGEMRQPERPPRVALAVAVGLVIACLLVGFLA